MKRRTSLAMAMGASALAYSFGGCSSVSERDSTGVSEIDVSAGPLISAQSGLCLDVVHNVDTPGTPLQIYPCNQGPNQGFSFTSAGELRVFNGTRCVQPQSGAGAPGMAATIAACDGQAHQQWSFNTNGSISSASSGLCLDVFGQKTDVHTPVNVWNCNAQTNQRWSRANAGPGVSMLTNRYDNQRTGSNTHETVLNTSNVNSSRFGLLYSRTVDGQLYAQPLYMSHVTFADGSVRNLVFAATMHNTVYAFDADGTSDTPVWSKNLGPSGPTSGFGCSDTLGEVGITATPVIDANSGIIYVLSKGLENGTWVQRLHALDLRTGAERAGSPTVLAASVSGSGVDAVNGKITFGAQLQLGRSGLLLDNGIVYMAFASHCDKGPYHGWILGYSYSGNSFAQSKVFNLSPNGVAGGIWQAGVGLSSDNDGIYFAAGNGSTNPAASSLDVSESVVRLGRDMSIQDYWIPKDYRSLNSADADLSSGAILLPHDRLLTGSKDGRLYVLNRTNLSKYNAGGDQILQTLTTPGKAAGQRGHLHGGPVYYQIPGGSEWIYLWPEQGPLVGYQMDPNTHLLITPEKQSALSTPGHPGGMLTLSSNGAPGSGILWASVPKGDAWHDTVPGILYAVDAADITHVLWTSDQNASRDAVGNFAKFSPPTVVEGRVFLGTFSNALRVYGLRN